VVVGPGDDDIRAALAPGAAPLPVTFVEQPEPRGMADALGRAAPHIAGDFLLSACDNLIPPADVARLAGRWRAAPRPDALLSLLPLPAEALGASGVVALDGERVTRIVEKPRPGEAPSAVASLPLYWFRPGLLELLPGLMPSPRGELELQDAITRLIDGGGRVVGARVSGRRTVTTAADLLDLNLAWLDEMGVPLLVEPGASVGPGCSLGPRVYIEAGSTVGPGARLRDVVVLRGGIVAAGADLRGAIVGGPGPPGA
jgi:glucose-1-phosphate thymidylyltransferase